VRRGGPLVGGTLRYAPRAPHQREGRSGPICLLKNSTSKGDTFQGNTAELYPQVNLTNISDDKLIDLYLQEFTAPGDTERSLIGYGYDTDYYFGFTRRDRAMISETESWLRNFFMTLDPCTAQRFVTGYIRPTDDEIARFLQTGEFIPEGPPPDWTGIGP